MRLLLDECVDVRLRQHFSGYDCQLAPAALAALATIQPGKVIAVK